MGCSQSKPVASSTDISHSAPAAATTKNVTVPSDPSQCSAVSAMLPLPLPQSPQKSTIKINTTNNNNNSNSNNNNNSSNNSSSNHNNKNQKAHSTQNKNGAVVNGTTIAPIAIMSTQPPSPHWTLFVWKQLEAKLLDPSDVHAVITERISYHINQLGAAELGLIQRRVRQITAQLPKSASPNKNRISRFTTTSSTIGGGEARGWIEKYHQLDDTIVRRIFCAADSLCKQSSSEWKYSKTESTLDIFGNLFTMLAHLSSEALWDRTATIAIDCAKSAGLERDVNKYKEQNATEAPLVPSLTQYVQDEPEGVIGVTFSSVCFCLGLGLRGSRNQRLQLLFYLFLSPQTLSTFLASHPAGGLPTWLLEIDSDVILSLASMSHYHYFGTALTSLPLNDELVKKKSSKALVINSWHVMSAITNLMTNNTCLAIATATEYETINGVDRSQDKAGRGRGTRRGSGTNDLTQKSPPIDTSHPTPVLQTLRSVRQGKINTGFTVKELDTFVKACEPHLQTESAALWTMRDFEAWTTEALSESDLDVVMHKLLATGILPSPELERDLVAKEWQAWQESDIKFWSLADDDISSLDLFSQNREGLYGAFKIEVPSQSQARIWGGIGGFDGRGGLGHGVMYVADKVWWDTWAEYVGWSWDGNMPNRPSRLRPQNMSTERLLDRLSDMAVAGTLGSYEIMEKDLHKDVDYVLLPTGVWDILYELYGGGPPLPRMVIPPRRIENPRDRTMSGEGKIMEDIDSVEVSITNEAQNFGNGSRLTKIPETLLVATHPWILHCHLCDATQPYRRGDAGPMSIRVMATPDQPLWRLYAEVAFRLHIHNSRSMDTEGRGQARLWRRFDPTGGKEPVSRYGPWSLLCKSRSALIPIANPTYEFDAHRVELHSNWQAYADGATVEGVGLANGDRIMLEYAVLNKNNDFIWPREAAATASRVRRLADEDLKFRNMLRAVDDDGDLMSPPPAIVGMSIDAMDSTGRWYQAEISQAECSIADSANMEEDDDRDGSIDGLGPLMLLEIQEVVKTREIKQIRVDFSENGSGGFEWIDVDSDRLAVVGRFTIDKEDESSIHSQLKNATEKNKSAAATKKTGNNELNEQLAGKTCILPGFGACGLNNLGNTCYANAAIQCMSYLPMLRSYLISSQYKATGDLNKDNPLGTGGKLLEEFAELMRIMWSGKYGERSPTRFRGLLGKQRSQFAAADQQDAQEFLNYMLDVLHEDSNKVKKKAFVEALEDDWVKENSLVRVGEEAWRRFLRRNRSIMADVAMGQVLNTVTCPKCHFSSRNFDPFNLLSIPFPMVPDVIFQVIVVRRATVLNSPQVLNKPKRGEIRNHRFERDHVPTDLIPPSEKLVNEQYVIAMSRLADIGDLKLRLQNISGIPASLIRLCKAEVVIGNKDADDHQAVKRYTRFVALPDKEGPCVQVAKGETSDDANLSPPPPTHIIAFESTLCPRPQILHSESTSDYAEEAEDEDTSTGFEDETESQMNLRITSSSKKELRLVKQLLDTYGDTQECRIFDTDPLHISKVMSRCLWPCAENEFKLGLRVDAIDHREHWFPGSVVEIIEGVVNGNSEHTDNIVKTKVRIHFDNFSSKWDEIYTIDHFERGKVRPLYSHASPRPKQTEFMVHHRYHDKKSDLNVLFGQGFYLHCQNEWSTARAGAHILGQASRYLQKEESPGGPIDVDQFHENEAKVQQIYEKSQLAVSDLIDLLLEFDRTYVREAVGLKKEHDEFDVEMIHLNPSFNATAMSTSLVKKVSSLLHHLPFEVRVCTVDTLIGGSGGLAIEEVPFPFSLLRTIGNYMNARHAIVLHWRDPPVEKKSSRASNSINAPVLYTAPLVAIHKSCSEILEEGSKTSKNSPGSGGLHLGVCLDEFCKVNQLDMSDCWSCPRCKEHREGKQTMKLWRLPDLLTFHIKRFNCSARWREKITTKINFPLTGLDVSEWCHPDSPAIRDGKDSHVYDLISVVNHYGGMTGGHYVATCKATACGPDGSEELAYPFPGAAAVAGGGFWEDVAGDSSQSNGWRLPGRKDKESVVTQQKQMAWSAAKNVSESAEPLWLQFDDDVVEPIPPRNVVSEMAYVLFYRRRTLSPANVAKYSFLE